MLEAHAITLLYQNEESFSYHLASLDIVEYFVCLELDQDNMFIALQTLILPPHQYYWLGMVKA